MQETPRHEKDTQAWTHPLPACPFCAGGDVDGYPEGDDHYLAMHDGWHLAEAAWLQWLVTS